MPPHSAPSIGRVSICIATYRRPENLRRLLDSLAPQVQARRDRVRVVVVDNDAGKSGQVVALSHPISAQYIPEPHPGISAARNAAVDAVANTSDWLAFVDDDEVVAPDWFDHFEAYISSTSAQVVAAPVISVLPDSTPSWITRGGFIQRPVRPPGPITFPPGTGNTFVAAELFRGHLPLRFSEEFSLTGGSDTELFQRMQSAGVSFHWCPTALAWEEVPVTRTTARWVIQRGIRYGSILARIQRRTHSRFYLFAGGIGRITLGLLRTLFSILRGRGLLYRDVSFVLRGIGFLEVSVGYRRAEYKRKTADTKETAAS